MRRTVEVNRPQGNNRETLSSLRRHLPSRPARGGIGFVQDPRLLLRGQPGELLPRGQHHRHLVRRERADLQPHRGIRARRNAGRSEPRREVGRSRRTALVYTFNLRKNAKWHSNKNFKPDPRPERRRRRLHVRAAVEGGQLLLQGHEPQPLLLRRHGHAQAAEVGREGGRLHRPDHAEPARGALPLQPRHDVGQRPVEGIRRRDAEGRHAREDRPGSDRHGPVLARQLPEGRGDPLQGLPGLLGRQGQDRRPRLRDHARTPPSAGPSCRRANATSCRIRTRPTWRP